MERLTRVAGSEGLRGSAHRVAITALSLTVGLVARDAAAQPWRPEPDKNVAPSPSQLAEAKERYEKGVKLYEDEGSVQAALVEFERAYDLAPNYKVLYNIGQAARTLRDFATALRAFEAYLEGGKDKIAKARATEVQRDIAQLRTYVATLTIQVDTEGAQVALDNVSIGTSPVAKPVLVNAGRTTVTATKAGRTATATVTLAGGDTQTVRIEVPAAPRATEPPRPEAPLPSTTTSAASPAPTAPTPSRTGAYLAFGVGSAFAVTAGVTGFAALRNANNLEKTRFAGPSPSAEAASLQTRTQRLSLASDVLLGAAVASVGVGVVLLVLEPSRPQPGLAHTTRAVRPFVGAGSAGVEGTF